MAKKRNKGVKGVNLVIYILAVILVVVMILGAYISLNIPISRQSFVVRGVVDERLGLVTSIDELDFGITYPGTPVERTLRLENHYPFPVKVKVSVSEDIKDVVFGQGSFEIEPEEEYEYSASFYPTQDTDFGNYTGQITFSFYRV